MSDGDRHCPDCGRARPRRVIPIDASPERAEVIKACDRLCTYCIDLKLVSGGFDVENILRKYPQDEADELLAAANVRRSELRLGAIARRRAREARPEKEQGAFL